MSANDKSIVIFGESGGGKSSLVNLLLGERSAAVSDKAVGCTFSFQKYATPNYNLFDTVGLSEGSQGTVKQDFAVKALIKLLKSLEDGVSLLIFVMRQGRITKSMEENYNLFVHTICMTSVPVVLVITHCEMEVVRGTWWKENKAEFDKYGMLFNAVVSGTAVQLDAVPLMMRAALEEMNKETANDLRKAINSAALTEAWTFKGGWQSWLFAVMKRAAHTLTRWLKIPIISDCITSYFSSDKDNLVQRLTEFFQSLGRNFKEAHEIARDIAQEID